LEAIRILLSFSVAKGFKLYQMDVKSAFLNEFLEEEVYLRQPPGFESVKFPHKVCRLRKALYGLKQAPRAWYGRLRGFLFSKGFEMGKVDETLFLLRQGDDILIVQVYVDDIVFGGSSHSLVARFAEDMSKEFKMSMMGELQFFLGLQIKQAKKGTLVHQAKYTKGILKKFKMDDSKPLSTPMSTTIALDVDEDGELVDQKEYRSMICSLLYLTATRPDIQFSVCLCTRFQASPRTSHRQAVKRIFRYLQYTPELGLWYRRPLPFRFLVFRMPTLRGVESTGSRLWGLVSFWIPHLFLDLRANSLPLVVAPSCFGSHTRLVIFVRSVPMCLSCVIA
jgi:hypothetical protein